MRTDGQTGAWILTKKLRKKTVGFVLFVRLSAWINSGPTE
jgi:hypothetical protein